MSEAREAERYEHTHRPGEDDALDAIEVLRAYADNPDGASEFADEFAHDAASEIRRLRSHRDELLEAAKKAREKMQNPWRGEPRRGMEDEARALDAAIAKAEDTEAPHGS